MVVKCDLYRVGGCGFSWFYHLCKCTPIGCTFRQNVRRWAVGVIRGAVGVLLYILQYIQFIF